MVWGAFLFFVKSDIVFRKLQYFVGKILTDAIEYSRTVHRLEEGISSLISAI